MAVATRSEDPDDARIDGPSAPETSFARRTRLSRQKIMHAAADAFAAHGYHKSSLNRVADSVGLTAAGVLHHFKTKEALLIEVLQRRDEIGYAEASVPQHPCGVALLQHLVDTMAANAQRPSETRLYAVLSVEAATDGHPAQDWFRGRYVRLHTLIEDALTDAAAEGQVAADLDAARAATAIIAVMDGLQVQWLYDPDRVDMAAVTAEAINSLVRPEPPVAVPEGPVPECDV